jgi:hypothetical protein
MLNKLRLPFALTLACLIALSSCGGGNSSQANGSGVGTGGTGSYTNGPISGLGSIIVNGVRYDVTGARVLSDDDGTGVHDVNELNLGMVVEVQGSKVTPGVNGAAASASADAVRFASDLVGEVTSAYDSGCLCIKVLGQTVRINSKTVQPAALARHDVVAVYGLSDVDGLFTATRIDLLPGASSYKIAGLVVSVKSKVLTFGQGSNAQKVSYASLSNVPEGIKAGARVRAWFDPKQVSGLWVATRIKVDGALVEDTEEASLEGLVSQTVAAGGLKINGSPVDVSKLVTVPALALGDRVRVEGRLLAGVLFASELSTQSDADIVSQEVELHGQISQLNTDAQTFVLRGVTVDYKSAAVTPGLASLTGSPCVEAEGSTYNDLRQLVATKVEVKASCSSD